MQNYTNQQISEGFTKKQPIHTQPKYSL